MAGNTVQVGSDNKLRVKTNGLVIGGAADDCCCGIPDCTACDTDTTPATWEVTGITYATTGTWINNLAKIVSRPDPVILTRTSYEVDGFYNCTSSCCWKSGAFVVLWNNGMEREREVFMFFNQGSTSRTLQTAYSVIEEGWTNDYVDYWLSNSVSYDTWTDCDSTSGHSFEYGTTASIGVTYNAGQYLAILGTGAGTITATETGI